MSNSTRWRPRVDTLDALHLLVGFGFVAIGLAIVRTSRVFTHPIVLGLVVWSVGVAVLSTGFAARIRARSR